MDSGLEVDLQSSDSTEEANSSTSKSSNLKPTGSCVALLQAFNSLTHVDDFTLKVEIGDGFFSKVYKVQKDGEWLALKLNHGIENRAHLLREIQILRKLNHPNVLRFKGTCVSAGSLHPITEFLNGGTLCDVIKDCRRISWGEKVLAMENVAEGMHYIHSQGIFHRDLASKNIFLRVDDRDRLTSAVVGDFGLADFIPPKNDSKPMQIVGSPFWMAPECLNPKCTYYDHKVDVFSYGIVLCELFAEVDADPDILPRRNDFGIDWESFWPMLHTTACPLHLSVYIEKCTEIQPEARPEFCQLARDLLLEHQALSSQHKSNSDEEEIQFVAKLKTVRSQSWSNPFSGLTLPLNAGAKIVDRLKMHEVCTPGHQTHSGLNDTESEDLGLRFGSDSDSVRSSQNIHPLGYKSLPGSLKIINPVRRRNSLSTSELFSNPRDKVVEKDADIALEGLVTVRLYENGYPVRPRPPKPPRSIGLASGSFSTRSYDESSHCSGKDSGLGSWETKPDLEEAHSEESKLPPKELIEEKTESPKKSGEKPRKQTSVEVTCEQVDKMFEFLNEDSEEQSESEFEDFQPNSAIIDSELQETSVIVEETGVETNESEPKDFDDVSETLRDEADKWSISTVPPPPTEHHPPTAAVNPLYLPDVPNPDLTSALALATVPNKGDTFTKVESKKLSSTKPENDSSDDKSEVANLEHVNLTEVHNSKEELIASKKADVIVKEDSERKSSSCPHCNCTIS